jgi:hypothetical protein
VPDNKLRQLQVPVKYIVPFHVVHFLKILLFSSAFFLLSINILLTKLHRISFPSMNTADIFPLAMSSHAPFKVSALIFMGLKKIHPLNQAGLSRIWNIAILAFLIQRIPTSSSVANSRPWRYLQMPTMILRVVFLLCGLSVVLGQVQYMGMNIAGFDFGCATNGSCDFTTMLPPLTSLGGSDGAGQMEHFRDDDIFNTFRLRWFQDLFILSGG